MKFKNGDILFVLYKNEKIPYIILKYSKSKQEYKIMYLTTFNENTVSEALILEDYNQYGVINSLDAAEKSC